jgi:hypothetical protein
MRHRIAATMGWSRFETLKTMLWATGYAPDGIYLSLRQGPRRFPEVPA